MSSAVIVTLIRRHMRHHQGKRVLLDGFPRSPENAHDLVELCGVPELALHLDCDDTILLERIIGRGRKGQESGDARADDNFDTALQRLRTYHKYHHPTIQWLREQHVPIGESFRVILDIQIKKTWRSCVSNRFSCPQSTWTALVHRTMSGISCWPLGDSCVRLHSTRWRN